MSSIVSRSKASSHPTRDGGIYIGQVKSVTPDGRANVFIPKLGNTIGPLRVLNSSTNNPIQVGVQVLCAHTNASTTEMYVLGYVNPITEQNDSSNIDGGTPASIYGGIDEIDAGGV
jgi:hypothetical protein